MQTIKLFRRREAPGLPNDSKKCHCCGQDLPAPGIYLTLTERVIWDTIKNHSVMSEKELALKIRLKHGSTRTMLCGLRKKLRETEYKILSPLRGRPYSTHEFTQPYEIISRKTGQKVFSENKPVQRFILPRATRVAGTSK